MYLRYLFNSLQFAVVIQNQPKAKYQTQASK